MKNYDKYCAGCRAKNVGKAYALFMVAIEDCVDYLSDDYVDPETRKARNRAFTAMPRGEMPRTLKQMYAEFLRAVGALPGHLSEPLVERLLELDPPQPLPDIDNFSHLEKDSFWEAVGKELVFWERMKRFSE